MTEQDPAAAADHLPGGLGAVAGSLLAGYRLERQIGHGGMAVVFLARDERLRRRVALKVLAPALASDAAFRRRFVKESLAAAAVDDPHILPIYAAGEADGVLSRSPRSGSLAQISSSARRITALLSRSTAGR